MRICLQIEWKQLLTKLPLLHKDLENREESKIVLGASDYHSTFNKVESDNMQYQFRFLYETKI